MEHHCLHEAEIATLRSESKDVKQDISDMRVDIKEILACIKGNGKQGLMTRMALLEQHGESRKWLVRTIGGAAIVSMAYVLKDAVLWVIKTAGG
jgi:hypothetical protein